MPRPEEEETMELDDTPKEQPHWKWKEGRPAVRPLKENQWEAFSNESEPLRGARQTYYKAHQPSYEQEGSYNLSSTFQEMATFANLIGTKVHEVQQAWTGQKDLRAAHHVAKTSPKDIHFFRIVLPTESPKIMGLRGIYSPEALQ